MSEPKDSRESASIHVDESALIVRSVAEEGYLGEESDLRFFCSWGASETSADEVHSAVRAIAWEESAEYPHPYVFQYRLSQVNWGASGGGVQFLLDVAAGLSVDAIIAGMGYALGRLRKDGPTAPEDLPFDGAESAREAILRSYELSFEDADALELVESEEGEDVSQYVFSAPSGNVTFECRVARLVSGDSYVRVKRVRRGDST